MITSVHLWFSALEVNNNYRLKYLPQMKQHRVISNTDWAKELVITAITAVILKMEENPGSEVLFLFWGGGGNRHPFVTSPFFQDFGSPAPSLKRDPRVMFCDFAVKPQN